MGEAFSVPFIPSWSAEIKKTVTPVPWNVALRRDNIIRQKNICHLIFEYGVHILLFCQSLLFRKQKLYVLLFIGGNFHFTIEPEYQ